ncbi:MAG: hypothetical protein KGN84_03745, partial [Acidobacteriota bacterium]|nr:hypothetical protein [Acidobacteriota bacterium]
SSSSASSASPAQNPSVPSPTRDAGQDKRAFGILPNYRTVEDDLPFSKIPAARKFRIAAADTFDGPSYGLAAAFSGISQSTGSNTSFHEGVLGYLHRYGTGLADQDIGNYMTEAIVPTLLHQDPRYFRRGHGSTWGRIIYAASRTIIARNDAGNWTFNAAEFLGNGVTGAIGNLYYPDSRGFAPTMQRMFTQISADTVSQVLREFWPDFKRKHLNKQKDSDLPVPAGIR